jgi:hypothetical protein
VAVIAGFFLGSYIKKGEVYPSVLAGGSL